MNKEDRLESMLRRSAFLNPGKKAELRDILRSSPCELTEEELENVSGGVYVEDFALLGETDFDEWRL